MSKKSLLALLLVMMMACCTVFTASAEGFFASGNAGMDSIVPSDGALTVSVALNINPDSISQLLQIAGQNLGDSLPADAIKSVVNILNNTAFKATIVGSAFQADLLMKDTPIVNLAGQLDDSGITVVTDLLPSFAVYVSSEELQQLMAQLQSSAGASGMNLSINPEDIQYVINLAVTGFTPLITKVMTSFGPQESGSWVFDGAEFTVRQPLNMTTKELVLSVMEAVNSILQDQKLQSILGGFGVKPEQLDLSGSIQDYQNVSEENIAELTFYTYNNANGETYFTLDLLKDDPSFQGIKAEGGMVGGNVVGHIVTLPAVANIDFAVQENGEFNMYFGMDAQAMGGNAPFSLMEVEVNGRNTGAGYNVDVNYKIDQIDCLTLKMAFEQGGQITASLDKTGKTILGMQDIMAIAQGGNTEALDAIKGELTTNAMRLLGTLATIMPDEITQLMTMVPIGR